VNAAAVRGGSLRAELLDASGVPIPGYALADCTPFAGDNATAVLAWGASASGSGGASSGAVVLPASPVRIRFRLLRARLYSFALCTGQDTCVRT
jgi:hypothetical protein